jgi:hypothetical protein
VHWTVKSPALHLLFECPVDRRGESLRAIHTVLGNLDQKNRPEVALSLVNDKTPVRLQWQREDVTGQGKRDAERCERLP